MKYGPNTLAVEAIIERAGRLTSDEIKSMEAAWNTAWEAARDAAWEAAWDAAWEAAWIAARDAAWEAAWEAAWIAVRDAAWLAVRDAVQDAVLAELVRDLITVEQYELLMGPWKSVVKEGS